jgi:hypothetical protein
VDGTDAQSLRLRREVQNILRLKVCGSEVGVVLVSVKQDEGDLSKGNSNRITGDINHSACLSNLK